MYGFSVINCVNGWTSQEVAKLPLAYLLMLGDELHELDEKLEENQAKFAAVVERKFGSQVDAAFGKSSYHLGTVHLQTEELSLTAKRQYSVAWDAKELAKIWLVLYEIGENPSQYIDTKYGTVDKKLRIGEGVHFGRKQDMDVCLRYQLSVSEKKINAWPPQFLKIISQAIFSLQIETEYEFYLAADTP